ncbi:MAG: lipoprotein-releasing ABC transporter permease subunit [Phenylobacterium sp.]|uniref:lipoprotein-releasing ABC transporter permease subunit n=1 Tax=Phenylobacterium sp. TaxID=1871053 RepID=UPI0027333A0E|nr:lipoprotein-releasing ABC transporter permease subunit [Phenylobacterium sp.]MDP3172974.1 lipoprotein-releasing ABC transporter permease subunit [Phenylobacterium sp.]
MSDTGGRAPPFGEWERSVAARYLRAKRKEGGVAMISIISFIGIMLAVAVLIIVMSVMNGFRTELLNRILGFNGHLYVAGGALATPERDGVVRRLADLPGVVQVTPVIEAQAMALGPAQISGAVVRGVSPRDLAATKIISGSLTGGSLQGFGVGEYGGDEIVVGARLAQSLGVRAGDSLTLISPTGGATAFGATPQRKTYTVAATFSVGMSEYDQIFIYMPLEQAQLFFGREGMVDFIEIKVANPDKALEMKDEVARAAGPATVVTDWTEKNAAFWGALKVERNVMRLILMMLVAIAAMNIISGLVMLVKNKSRDIAILRTMGAGQGSILRIFFMAGASVGVLGTIAGLAIGVLFCIFIGPIQHFVEWATGAEVFSSDVYFLSHVPAKVDWSEVAIIVGWALALSFLATLPPSWRASRIDPVEALRYE